jgi:aspartyl protease family protein
MLRIALALAAFASMLALGAPQIAATLVAVSASRSPVEPAQRLTPRAAIAEAQPDAAAGETTLEPDRFGQFGAEVEINGQPVRVMVDTGATFVVLSYETAARIGLQVLRADYTGRVQTANGVALVAPITLSHVALGSIYLGDVQALVAERGATPTNLLGMSFLRRLASVEQKSGRLVLRQ